MKKDKSVKIGLKSLVLMIFSAIFGFSNSLTAYYQMGYASIVWYIITAVLFFLPSALIFAEYGAAFKGVKGGIFSWLKGSVSEKTAFIGTFIWLAAWVVWLVSSTQFFLVSVSTAISGHDTTQSWHFLNLSSTQLLGVLEVIFLVVVTFFAAKGVDKIAAVSNVGGFFTLAITIGFTLVSILVFFLNHGRLAEPLTAQSLVHSPNPAFQSPIAVVSFIVYALFAYGGLDNVEYVLINNLGVETGKAFGLSHSASLTLGAAFSRFAGLADVLAGISAAFLMVYSPVKSFIEGCDPKLLPKSLVKLNKHGMPERSMWVQAAIVSVIILFISFGGNAAGQFYTILMDMMNVSSSAPYLFLIGAYPFFKMKKSIDRPFVFIEGKKRVWAVTIVVWLVVAIGIVFTCIEPLFTGDYATSFWTAIGPVAFGIIAWVYYSYQERKSVAVVDEEE